MKYRKQNEVTQGDIGGPIHNWIEEGGLFAFAAA